MKNILLLDDDPLIHQLVRSVVTSLSFQLFSALTVAEATKFVTEQKIEFAVCDLFLEGDLGDQLSNNFIREVLVPNKISYCRLTSAPSLVPEDCRGINVIDKSKFYQSEMELYEVLLSSI